jgi:hypothetical protein
MFRWILPRRFNTCGHNWNNSNIDGLAAEALNIERNHWRMWWRRFKVSLLRNSALRIGEFFRDSFGILLGFFWDFFGIHSIFDLGLFRNSVGIILDSSWIHVKFLFPMPSAIYVGFLLHFICYIFKLFWSDLFQKSRLIRDFSLILVGQN